MRSLSAAQPHAVAVVIPTYNCGSSLAEAIESVLAQSYRNFRIFVVDDGSTDTTARVMDLYSDTCVYLRQANAGPSVARNRGIFESSSEYIAFLDADDLWHPTKLEKQVQFLIQNPEIGLVCSDFSSAGSGESVDSFFARSYVPADGRMFKYLIDGCIVFTSSVVVRRQVLEEVGGFNESLSVCEDMNLWCRIASRWKIAAMREVLVSRRNRPEGLSAIAGGTIISLRNGLASLQHIESVSSSFLSHEQTKVLERRLALFYYKSGSSQLTSGARKPAREHLVLALRYKPLYPTAVLKLGGSLLPAPVFKLLSRFYRMTFR